MKIMVPVKRVLDPMVPVRIDESGLDVVSENMPHAMNPFDEIALTEAATLKNDLPDLEIHITAVSIGPPDSKEILRTALAMGADRAIHILCEQELEPLAVAELLDNLANEIDPDLILMGKQAVDSDNGQIGPLLAGKRNCAQACGASKLLLHEQQLGQEGFLTISPEKVCELLSIQEGQPLKILVARETDIVLLHLPAVITCDLSLNQPRPVGLPAVMKARRTPIEQRAPIIDLVEPTHINDYLPSRMNILRLFEPPTRPACHFLPDGAALASLLKQKGLTE